MSKHDHPSFDANKIFLTLFLLTAVEVGWSLLPMSKFFVWGGLMLLAFMKGLLIFMYFMHMKFEGWVVKCLIAPTPILVLVVIFALFPDVARNGRLDHPISDMLDPQTGQVIEISSMDAERYGGEDHGQEGGH